MIISPRVREYLRVDHYGTVCVVIVLLAFEYVSASAYRAAPFLPLGLKVGRAMGTDSENTAEDSLG